ncbi:MAG TPA: hypothetical protein VL426_08020 [Candidatus Binatia bacterium]|jgi:hypothetical protein|nr:hypothetical protein [Candidatus Binatia bacterium]
MSTRKPTAEEAANFLKNVPEEWQAFWCNHGTVLRNYADLSAALADMTPEEFAHHVNGEKNDFAEWTAQVFGDKTLADKLRLLSTPEASQRMVARRIEELTLAARPVDAAPVEAAIAERAEAAQEAPAAIAQEVVSPLPAEKPSKKAVKKPSARAKKTVAAKKAVASPAPKTAAAKPAGKKESVWSKLLKR